MSTKNSIEEGGKNGRCSIIGQFQRQPIQKVNGGNRPQQQEKLNSPSTVAKKGHRRGVSVVNRGQVVPRVVRTVQRFARQNEPGMIGTCPAIIVNEHV